MNKDEIKHLAELSRLELSENELEMYAKDIPEILGYVDKLKEVSTSDSERVESASVRNVFREDDSEQESGIHTENILNEAPDTKDGFVKVKKILENGSN